MSSRAVIGAFLVGVLAAAPALAQERHARARGEQGGGDRGGNRGSGGDGGGQRRASGGGGGEARVYQRAVAPQRAPEGRSYTSGRQVESRQYTAPRQYNNTPRQFNNAPRQYTAPRAYGNAGSYNNGGYSNGNNGRYNNGRYNNGRYNNGRYNNGRYNNGSYNNGGYNARQYTAPRVYNNGRGYSQPYAYSNRGYAPPRAPYYRGYARPYYAKPYYSRPYYYHGYRGVYGYGHGYSHSRIVTVVPWRPYYYRPHFSIGIYYGAGGVYDYGYTPSYYYDPIPGRVYGGVRITEAPRDAQVFADGHFVGIVDDFDGVFQHVNLEAGQHRIEVRGAEFPPISFDVYVQPGRTITLRADDYNDGYADPNANADGY
jgi:hypothetical protein